MARLEPLPSTELAAVADVFAKVTSDGGWVPNMYLTMARHPGIMRAFATLGWAVMGPGTVPPDLKSLVAFVASNTAGCRFCATHQSRQALKLSVSEEKLRHAFEYEDHPVFSEAERAALSFARDAALHPPEVDAGHFARLKLHFSEQQIVELLSVACLFAFTNRWHEVVGTDLEPGYESFISEQLAPLGWKLAPPRS